jgi:hypothetical protein
MKISDLDRTIANRLKMAAELLASQTKSAFTRKSGTPSEPGEFPAKQTGKLANSVNAVQDGDGWKVTTDVEYAKYLKASGRKMISDAYRENAAQIRRIMGAK